NQVWHNETRLPAFRIVPENDAVFVAEPVAEIVADAAKLGAAGGGLKFASVRLHAKIAPAEFDLFAALSAFNDIVTDAACAVDPAIQAPRESIHLPLLVFRAETSEENFFHVGLAVAIGVFGIDDVRGRAYKSSPPPGHYSGGIGQMVEENRGLVI